MIFDERHVGPIHRQEKTRASYPMDKAPAVRVGDTPLAQTIKLISPEDSPDGKEHRSHETIARVRIVAVTEGLLHQVTKADARREGFASREEFFVEWRRRFNEGPGTAKVVIEIPIVVCHFELDSSHHPRLLARRSIQGYTENPNEALLHEPEAVDKDTLARFAAEGQGRGARRRADEFDRQQIRRLVARLRQAKSRARATGVDLSLEINRMEAEIAAMERKLGQAA